MAYTMIQIKWFKYTQEQNEIYQKGNNGSLLGMRL